VDFIIFGCVYMCVFLCLCVCMCGSLKVFLNECSFVCLAFVMCWCIYIWCYVMRVCVYFSIF